LAAEFEEPQEADCFLCWLGPIQVRCWAGRDADSSSSIAVSAAAPLPAGGGTAAFLAGLGRAVLDVLRGWTRTARRVKGQHG